MKRKKQDHGKPGRKVLNIIKQYFPKVTTVVDANSHAIIEVMASDSTEGMVKNPALCAFAKACYRSFRADGVIIGLKASYIIRGKEAVRYHNTEALSREIVSFDRKAGFDTGRYLLSPHCPSARLGVFRGTSTHPKTGGKDRRVFRHFTRGVRVLSHTDKETL